MSEKASLTTHDNGCNQLCNKSTPGATARTLLETRDLSLHYGQIRAVDGVNLAITEGTCHALIGPNGAGKSSLFATLAGAVRPTAGRIYFDHVDITADDEVLRARTGVTRTFQHSNLFVQMSVRDNVQVALERRQGSSMRPWSILKRDKNVMALALDYLHKVGLEKRAEDHVEELSHGERRQLEIAVAWACEPRILLLDEPTAGMSAAETQRFTNLMLSLSLNVTTIIVEHDLEVVFNLAERVSVLASGQLIADGTPDEIRADEHVNSVYLGSDRSSESLFTGGGE